jgi:hypothetical protein
MVTHIFVAGVSVEEPRFLKLRFGIYHPVLVCAEIELFIGVKVRVYDRECSRANDGTPAIMNPLQCLVNTLLL